MVISSLFAPPASRRPDRARLPVFGVDVEVLVDGSQTHGEMSLYRVTAPVGAGAPPHRNVGQDEIFHVVTGTFDLACDGAVRQLQPGDFAFVPRGVTHAFTCTSADTGSLLITGTPAGHGGFFRDSAAALAAGAVTPEQRRQVGLIHGSELVGAAS